MSNANFIPSLDDLNALFFVDDGRLIRKKQAGGKVPGAVAGTTRLDGYIGVGVKGKYFFAHRLIWMMCKGYMPVNEIDHINGIKTDNRIENLRECTRGQNTENTRTARKTNITGVLGVRFDKRCKYRQFRAMAWKNGKNVSLGYFDTAEKAHSAYLEWKRENHEFCTL